MGGSFRSDKDSISRFAETNYDISRPHPVSMGKLYGMVRPDWMYGMVGTLSSFVTGSQMPLFALGVTQALVSYYMGWEDTQREVKKIAFLFCGGAVLTVIFHVLVHLNFGIVGERLTLRVRERMFAGR
jgi:ATP-binding cassette, subfamily B (MDR/TAP), member 1